MRRAMFSSARTLPVQGVFGQVGQGLRGKLLLPPVPPVEAGQELRDQQQDLPPSLAQRGTRSSTTLTR